MIHLRIEEKKAVLIFLVLFLTWQSIYFFALKFPILYEYWLFAYLAVFIVAILFFVLDRQKAVDLGFKKQKAWKKYVIIGFVLAYVYILYLAGLGSILFSIGPVQVVQHGILSVPYNASFALIVGLVEEASFRGYILRNLHKVHSETWAIACSSILFGMYHLSLVLAFLSTSSTLETFAYWTLVVAAAFVIGLFLGYFYMNTGRTIIGTLTYHSSSIFLESLMPYGLATSQLSAHLFSTTVYIIMLPLLIFLKKKGWLTNTRESD